jgi:peptidyl-prolyl cis-trans isomerase-like 4
MALLLETIWGDLVVDLDIQGSPELCKNILKLAKARFYTNTLIFSVTPNRFCQAGDPVGDGTGGASIYGLTDEDSKDYHTSKRRFVRSVGRWLLPSECREKGRVVATNTHISTPDTIGSQFLITLASGADRALDGYHMVPVTPLNESAEAPAASSLFNRFLSLGKVVEDENGVLDKINAAYCDPDGRPYADIRILRALVIHDPFDDVVGMERLLQLRGVEVEVESGRVVRSPSPDRPAEERVVKRISAADIVLDDNDSVDEETRARQQRQEEEKAAQMEAKSQAVVLEMLGDLPDADIRAPEDVLFICKLNPITVDEDLELIFSRFDEAVKVEIIRDPDTGASLQYAFAEFTSKQAAVEAYFKMNNALVDDRRIKVDFSQSVAKLWNKYKQKLRMPAQPLDPVARSASNHVPRREPPHRPNQGIGGGGGTMPRHDSRYAGDHGRRLTQQNGASSDRDDFGRSRDLRHDSRDYHHSGQGHRHPDDNQKATTRRHDENDSSRHSERYSRARDSRDSVTGSDDAERAHNKHKRKHHVSRRHHSRRRHDSDSESEDDYRHSSHRHPRRRERDASSEDDTKPRSKKYHVKDRDDSPGHCREHSARERVSISRHDSKEDMPRTFDESPPKWEHRHRHYSDRDSSSAEDDRRRSKKHHRKHKQRDHDKKDRKKRRHH